MGVHTLSQWGFGLREQVGGGRNKKRFSCIYSCRAAAPGVEQYVCATREEGPGCSAPQLEAAGDSALTRIGPSFRKTPEE